MMFLKHMHLKFIIYKNFIDICIYQCEIDTIMYRMALVTYNVVQKQAWTNWY